MRNLLCTTILCSTWWSYILSVCLIINSSLCLLVSNFPYINFFVSLLTLFINSFYYLCVSIHLSFLPLATVWVCSPGMSARMREGSHWVEVAGGTYSVWMRVTGCCLQSSVVALQGLPSLPSSPAALRTPWSRYVWWWMTQGRLYFKWEKHRQVEEDSYFYIRI